MIRRMFLSASLAATMASLVMAAQDSSASLSEDARVATALSLARVWLEAQRAYTQIPGISAAIVYDQRSLWSGGYGYADVASKRAATPDTIYSICSISKLFTSVAVMQLRDAGKLRLDDPVTKHLPWFTIKRSDPDAPEITVEGLLTHAAGLPREADFPYWREGVFPTHDQIVAKVREQETLYPAEKYFQYSNLGLTLAGEIVAAASGVPYDDYIRRNILQPLGLGHTTPEMPESERGRNLATGYGAIGRDGQRATIPFFVARGIAPAAGYASTVNDLGRFASWQLRLLTRGGTEILNANTLREMQRVHFVDPDFEITWGLGFVVSREEGKTFVGHDGSCPGFLTSMLMRPDEKIATVFFSNAQGIDVTRWTLRLYDIVAPAIRAAIKDPAAAKPLDASLEPYLGTYSGGINFGGETAVVRWEDSIALLRLPTMEPVKDLLKLKKVGDHRFRRVRSDDSLGEDVLFEMGPDGKAARFTRHSNYSVRQ